VSKKLPRRQVAAFESLSVTKFEGANVIEMPLRNGMDDLPTRIARRRNALTVGELAELLNASANYVYDPASAGQIPHYRIRGCIRFDPGKIARWLLEKAS